MPRDDLSYRTDWIDRDLDPHGNTVRVSYHGDDLKAAQAAARKQSRKHGSAYIIRTTTRDGVRKDDGHIPYTEGSAAQRGWEV